MDKFKMDSMLFEDRFIYFPERGGVGPSPGEDVTLTSSDGLQVHGWFVPHGDAKATILHLHGNAGNLEGRRRLVLALHALGVNVLAIDYRGYGKSEGRPSEAGLSADARAAYDWLLTKTSADRIVVHGESLGGGPSCELASTVLCGGLILQSTFTSIPDMVHRLARIVPRFIVRTKFDNLSKISTITCRKLFLHSRTDEMIPFDMAESLFAAAAEPKENVWLNGVGHNETTTSDGFAPAVAEFLAPFGT